MSRQAAVATGVLRCDQKDEDRLVGVFVGQDGGRDGGDDRCVRGERQPGQRGHQQSTDGRAARTQPAAVTATVLQPTASRRH